MTTQPSPLEFTITGMDCADCALTVQTGVNRLDGVTKPRSTSPWPS